MKRANRNLSIALCLVTAALFAGCANSPGAKVVFKDGKIKSTTPGMTTLWSHAEGGHAMVTQDLASASEMNGADGNLALVVLGSAHAPNMGRFGTDETVLAMPGSFKITEEYSEEGAMLRRTIEGDTSAQIDALAGARVAIRESMLGVSGDMLDAKTAELATLLGISEVAAEGLISGIKMMIAP